MSRYGRLRTRCPDWSIAEFDDGITCPGMLAHVNDALRMPLGEVTPASKKLALRHFPLKQLFIYVFPFPNGLPTAPELLARTSGARWADEVALAVGRFGR